MTARKPDRRFPIKTTVFVVLTVGIILAVPVSHLIWGSIVAHRLKRTLTELHAAGEPLTSAEMNFDSIPDTDNASLNYRIAGDSIDHSKLALKKYENADSSEFQLPLTDNELAVVQTILAENKIALAQLNAASGKHAGGWNDHFEKLEFPVEMSLNGERDLCNLLKLSAMQAHSLGNDHLTADRLKDLLNVADAAELRPTYIAHLVAVGTTAFAGQTIFTIAPFLDVNKAGVSADQLRDLINQLQDESQIDLGNKLGWRSERIVDLNFLTDVTNGQYGPSPSAGGDRVEFNSPQFSYLMRPILLENQAFLVQYLQDVMLASTAPDWPAAEKKIPTTALNSVRSHPYYDVFLTGLALSYDKAIMAGYRAKAIRRLAAAAVAVRLYAADHNDALPNSLADLVPAYLPAIPIDPMSGQPMKYKPDPPRIYSVGDDGIDDNGIPVDSNSPNPFHRHHGDIVVYLTLQPRKTTSSN